MKLVTYEEIYSILSRKEEQIVHILKRNAQRSSRHLSPDAEMLRNQKIEAQNIALNTLLKEIRDIIDRDFFKFSDYSVRRFYLVNQKELHRLKKDSLIFYMFYEGSLCKLAVTMNQPLSKKNYHLYVPSVEKELQKNPIK